MAVSPEVKEQIKKYITYCKRNKDVLFGKNSTSNAYLNSLKLPMEVREKINFELTKTLECTSSSSVEGYTTPFAFSGKNGIGNVRAAECLGFKLVTPQNKNKAPQSKIGRRKLNENGQISAGFDGIATSPDLLDGELVYTDEEGFPQHGDPNEDPELDGRAQSMKAMQNSMYERINKAKRNKILGNATLENVNKTLAELLEDVPLSAQTHTIQSRKNLYNQRNPAQNTNKRPIPIQVANYDILKDFSQFDIALKNTTEEVKIKYQKAIQDKLIGKKVILRASKGYKQPESDYTVNVTGVQLDYYYDRYVVIVVGREEQKQKTFKFFVKPGFKIKILGSADIKEKDEYNIAKSNIIVNKNVPKYNGDSENTNITA